MVHDVDACRKVLINEAATLGMEIIVSTAPPIFSTPYSANPMRCPHGVTLYSQPSAEQVLRWREAGTR